MRRLRAAGRSTRNVSLRAAASDYPDVAVRVTDVLLAGGARRGVLLCGSGVGASVAANKRAGIRAGLAATLVEALLKARFSRAPCHLRRLRKVRRLESGRPAQPRP